MIDDDELNTRFQYHKPDEDKIKKHETIRNECLKLGFMICANTPACREQSLAITNLEEAMMWANAAIARRA
jgi:hypothetical protein